MAAATLPVNGPSRFSIIRSVTNATTTASTSELPIEKNQLATIVSGSAPVGPRASLVISVIIASIGPRIGFTPNTEPTAAKHIAMPASGCRPTDMNAAAPSGTRIR